MSVQSADFEGAVLKSREALPPIPTKAFDDFVPPELLAVLVKPMAALEDLGPDKQIKASKKGKHVSVAHPENKQRPPDNVWNHPSSREKYKHMTEQPPCTCGAGRDISFLSDAATSRKKSSKARQRSTQVEEPKDAKPTQNNVVAIQSSEDQYSITDSLIPSEFHIIKKPGVLGLDVRDGKYSTVVADHSKHLTMFPSMNPSGRQEALQLANTMDILLQQAGIDDEEATDQDGGPSQIHALLQLLKKEQTIYNLVFSEVIRQVSVDCAERGALLAKLRQQYVRLLDKVPRQVKSLHEEILAQRALDRRLTEELTRFKSTVVALTRELRSVQQHDEKVSRRASETQEELNEALKESEKNAGLLAEFHELYDLQRKRLELQIERLIEEKDIWAGAAYTMAIKVTMKHNLTTAKRLHLHEKSWHKLSGHFIIVLSDADSIELEELSNHVQMWHGLATKFHEELMTAEREARTKLVAVGDALKVWSIEFHDVVSADHGTVTPPDASTTLRLLGDLKSMEDVFVMESERFSGDALLAFEDSLIQMAMWMDRWTEAGIRLFGRHTTANEQRHPQHETMLQLNTSVLKLQTEYKTRMNGDNGLAKGVIDFVNVLGTWTNKLTASVNGGEPILDTEWLQLTDRIQSEWQDSVKGLINLLSCNASDKITLGREESTSDGRVRELPLKEIADRIHKWLLTSINSIECADASINDQLADTHACMIRWMCTVLLRLAPDFARDKSNSSGEARGIGSAILSQSTSDEILHRGHLLVRRLKLLTNRMAECCRRIVHENAQKRRDRFEDEAESEVNDLKRMALEADQWIEAANALAFELTGQMLPEDKIAGDTDESEAGNQMNQVVADVNPEPEPDLADDDETSEATSSNPQNGTTELDEEVTIRSCDGPASPGITADSSSNNDDAVPLAVHVLSPDQNITTQLFDGHGEKQMDSVTEHASTELEEQAKSLSSLEEVQRKLIQSESRAIANETRALRAEDELKASMKRIRDLERQLGKDEETQKMDSCEA